jgi:IclR family mhp operon transcriptional activator
MNSTDAIYAQRELPDELSPMRGVMRTLQVLRALNVRNGASVAELSRVTRVSRGALYRVLETLRSAGYVKVDLSKHHYCLTLRVKELAEGFNDEDWVTQIARPAIQGLQRRLRWPVDLATFMDGAMWIRESTRPASPFTIDRGGVGCRVPVLISASGRAYLANCADSDRELIVRHVIAIRDAGYELAVDPSRLEQLLTATRARGFGIREGEYAVESGAIAVPIRLGDRILGCVTLTFNLKAIELRDVVASCLLAMRKAADEISEQLRRPAANYPSMTPSNGIEAAY